MITALAVIALTGGGGIALFTLIIVNMHKPGNGRHTDTPYIPNGNPWRVGNTVLICEDPARPEMNWYGTVLNTRGGLLTVRDTSSPFHVVDLEKMYAYPVGTNLGW